MDLHLYYHVKCCLYVFLYRLVCDDSSVSSSESHVVIGVDMRLGGCGEVKMCWLIGCQVELWL